MELPQGLGSLDKLKKREAKAFEVNALWQSTLDDAYDYFLPQRNLFSDSEKGQKKTDHIFDGTSLQAIQNGASRLQENIAPIWARWANFEPSEQILKLLEMSDEGVTEEDIRRNLEDQAKIVFDYINRSNFGTQFYEFALDLLIGTGSMMIDESDSEEMPIVFNTIAQNGIAFEEGAFGTVETHWRRFKVKARTIEQKWRGFKPSAEVREIIAHNPETEIDVHEGLIYNTKDKRYYGVVWVKGEDHISWLENFEDSSPLVTARYSKVSGEIRGRGVALQVLPDVKSLNKAKEFVLTKAAIDLAGIWTATDDGVTNPYSMQITAGLVIPVGSNNSQNPSIQRLDTRSDLQLAQFEIIELQNTIKKALFEDLREPSDSVVSATQFAIEARDFAKRVGSAFGRLQTEALIPIIKRVHWILKRKGLVDPIKVNGVEVAIKFTSPIAKAQDAEDLLSVQQAVQFTLETAGPERAQMAFKLEDFGTWAAKKTGMPQELVRSEPEKQKVIQAGAQAAMVQNGLQSNQPA